MTRRTRWVSISATSAVKGEDSRVDGDVLLADLDDLAFDIGDFSGFTFGGEWLYGIGDFIETGVGVGYYQKSSRACHRDFVDVDGTEILQDLKLRVCRSPATVRFLPLGRAAAVQPYVGGGIGIFNWRYTETGEFVDFSDGSIFRDRYEADGTAFGPVVLGGLRFPIGDAMTTGVEFRWQKAEGDTKPDESRLLAPKIDLGGWTTSWNFHFRFNRGASPRRIPIAVARGALRPAPLRRARRSPIEGYAASFCYPFEAIEERPRARAIADRRHRPLRPAPQSATHRTYALGPTCIAAFQTSPLPSCRKSCTSKPSRDRVVHVVSERPHAHHDRLAVAVSDEICSDGLPSERVLRISLRLGDHRRAIDRAVRLATDAAATASVAATPRAHLGSNATPVADIAAHATTSGTA